jgi:hypothetical protein
MALPSRDPYYDPEPLQSLTNRDFSDIALLHVFDDCLDEDGTTDSAAIASALELETDHPRQNVGIRLAWLARYGVIVQQSETKRWQWTTQGEKAFRATLTRGQERALHNISDEAMLKVMHNVGDRLDRLSPLSRTLLRREWNHSYDRTKP